MIGDHNHNLGPDSDPQKFGEFNDAQIDRDALATRLDHVGEAPASVCEWSQMCPREYGIYLWKLKRDHDPTACCYCPETGNVQFIGSVNEQPMPTSGYWKQVWSQERTS